jgi:ATP-binding cassette, subfamily B, bacterial
MRKKIASLVGLLVALGILAKGSNSILPLVIQRIIDSLASGKIIISHWLLVVVAVSILIIISDVLGGYFAVKLSNLLKQNYRIKILSSLYHRKIGEFYKNSTAEYVSLLNNNIRLVVENYYITLLTIFKCSITLCVSIASLIYLDYRLMLVVILSTVLPLLNPLLFGKKLNQNNNELNKCLKNFNSSLTDFLGGYLFAKVNQFKNRILNHTVDAGMQVNRAEEKLARTNGLAGIFSGFLGYGGYVLIIGYGVSLVNRQIITIGALFAAIQIADNIAPPMTAFSHLINMVKSMKGMKVELDELANSVVDKTEKKQTLKKVSNMKLVDANLTIDNRIILQNVNFKFEEGKKYMIVGRSGSGKSSLLKLLSGIYEPTEGNVFINDIPWEKINEDSFFQQVGIVEQESFILNDTLERNIFLNSNADKKAKDYVEGVLNLKTLFEHVSWDMNCVNGGYGLSGGEKQRIALVRMMIKGQHVLILDEPTSAMDNQTRREFEEWILQQQNNMVINVSHHWELDLLKQYDAIVVMENGTIKRVGTPNEILEDVELGDYFRKENREECY